MRHKPSKSDKIADFIIGLGGLFGLFVIVNLAIIFIFVILQAVLGNWFNEDWVALGFFSFILFSLIGGSIYFYRKKRYYILAGAGLGLLLLAAGLIYVQFIFSKLCC